MPSSWNHKADKDLLFSIIEDGNLTGIDWQSVATKMKAKEYTFSHEACRQHYQKMRREAKSGGSSNGDAGNSTPSRAKATPSKGTPSKRKGKGLSDNDDDEEDLSATPSKRKKNVKKESTENGEEYSNGFASQTATQFKMEYQNGIGTVDLADDDLYAA